ncbi:MAG: hydrogenase accessory protein [Paracoccaceae bacterium]|nr:hydrogenase accessory protein [Paracoccaceae bacterium]
MHDHAPHDHAPASGKAPHPLITRLETELHWPRLHSLSDLAEFVNRPGAHCLFIPGDPARNLETADAAVILPELRMVFQHAFDCAVVDDAIEAAVRETHKALKTPGFLFFQQGRFLGAVEKIRDWDDYMTRITHILGQSAA